MPPAVVAGYMLASCVVLFVKDGPTYSPMLSIVVAVIDGLRQEIDIRLTLPEPVVDVGVRLRRVEVTFSSLRRSKSGTSALVDTFTSFFAAS